MPDCPFHCPRLRPKKPLYVGPLVRLDHDAAAVEQGTPVAAHGERRPANGEWPGTDRQGIRLMLMSWFEENDVLQPQVVNIRQDGLPEPAKWGLCNCDAFGMGACCCAGALKS